MHRRGCNEWCCGYRSLTWKSPTLSASRCIFQIRLAEHISPHPIGMKKSKRLWEVTNRSGDRACEYGRVCTNSSSDFVRTESCYGKWCRAWVVNRGYQAGLARTFGSCTPPPSMRGYFDCQFRMVLYSRVRDSWYNTVWDSVLQTKYMQATWVSRAVRGGLRKLLLFYWPGMYKHIP